MSEFSDPSTGVKITDFKGSLLIVEPTEFVESINTAFGETTAVRANVHVLDGTDDGEPQVHEDALIFPRVLQSTLKSKVGKGKVLGRLAQRPPSKAGQSPAWVLNPASDDDKRTAKAYWDKLSAATDVFATS